MKNWFSEYVAWDKENHEFYDELQEHNSVLYDRFLPVYSVLNELYHQAKAGETEAADDIEKIVSVGLEFLHDQFDTCKLYLETKFQGDFHRFLDYDKVVNAMLFIDDLKYELEEKQAEYDRDSLERLQDELEAIIDKKAEIKPELTIYIDDKVNRIISNQSFELYGIVDIFADIADTLGIELFSEDEILIGKDI